MSRVGPSRVLLAAFVEEGDLAAARVAIAAAIERLQARSWPTGSPMLTEPDVGAVLPVRRPGQGTRQNERDELEATERFLSALAALTRDYDLVLVVEYDGEAIGWLDHGHVDETIEMGLLQPWREAIRR